MAVVTNLLKFKNSRKTANNRANKRQQERDELLQELQIHYVFFTAFEKILDNYEPMVLEDGSGDTFEVNKCIHTLKENSEEVLRKYPDMLS